MDRDIVGIQLWLMFDQSIRVADGISAGDATRKCNRAPLGAEERMSPRTLDHNINTEFQTQN